MKKKLINKGAQYIQKGEIIAFPTETVYGLGANALDKKAVEKIFLAKGRPKDNPFIVHVADLDMLRAVVKRVPQVSKKMMNRFWPGPLTILFEKHKDLPSVVTAGLPTVAVRMPAHPIALSLIKQAGVPIAAPSANKSGRPSPTSAAHVREDFGRKLFIIDGGETEHGLESTVISLQGKPKILRLGAISYEQLKKVIPNITLDTKIKGAAPSSPGQKYKHYAPKQPMILFSHEKKIELIRYAKSHKGTVILCQEKFTSLIRKSTTTRVVSLGKTDEDVAHNLYHALRTVKGNELLVLGIPKKGIGRAVMDRLERAATRIV